MKARICLGQVFTRALGHYSIQVLTGVTEDGLLDCFHDAVAFADHHKGPLRPIVRIVPGRLGHSDIGFAAKSIAQSL